MMKERFPAQRRFKLLPRESDDLRTNPSQEEGNDVNKRARRTLVGVDVIFEQRIKSRLRFPKFKKIQNLKQDLIKI